MVDMDVEGEELTWSQIVERQIMGYLWPISCRFLNIGAPGDYGIHKESLETQTCAIDMPVEGGVDNGDMHSSAGPTILIRGYTGVKEDGNPLKGCMRAPSVGYMRYRVTV